MTRLREAFIDAVTEGIVRAFVWLLGGELTIHPVKPPFTPSRRCNEFQLLVLFRIDGTLAYVFGTSPEPGHRIDTRFRQ